MAIYHCSIKLVKRSMGRSVVAAAAYRSGTRLVNEWDGMTHDYTKKGGVVYSEILLPAHAPLTYQDRSVLWNSVEKIENSRTAQLAREIEIALPNELPRDEQINMVHDYCSDFADAGMCVDFSVHAPQKEQENVHAHILLTLRPIQPNGEWGAKCRKEYDLDDRGQRIPDGKGGWKNHRVNTTDWNDPTKAEQWRSAWADLVNQTMERNGLSERVDHRSYIRQGIAQIPTIHMGVAASQMEQRGIVTEKGNINREIAQQNKLIKEIKARLTRLYNWSKEQSSESTPKEQPSLLEWMEQAWEQQHGVAPHTRYGVVKNLKEDAAIYNFIQANDIHSLDDLHGKISSMQDDYYALRGKIVGDEKEIARLSKHLEQWKQYSSHRELAKQAETLRPKAQEKFRTEHTAELILYEAAKRYLGALKEQGEKITPKSWERDISQLTTHKNALYTQMKGMREEIKVAEQLRKAADQLSKQQTEKYHEPER